MGNMVFLTVDWGLTRKLLKHLGGTSETITRLTNRDVEGELGDAELLHRILGLRVGLIAKLAICLEADYFQSRPSYRLQQLRSIDIPF